jgi:hypothetical protein
VVVGLLLSSLPAAQAQESGGSPNHTVSHRIAGAAPQRTAAPLPDAPEAPGIGSMTRPVRLLGSRPAPRCRELRARRTDGSDGRQRE